jgi:hypothetical protein
MLWDTSYFRDQRLKILRADRHSPERKLILRERAHDLSFSNGHSRNTENSLSHVRMAGLWLAKLHSIPVANPGVCSYAKELASAHFFAKELSAARPVLARKFELLEEAIEQKFTSFRNVSVVMVHGDYRPEHIFVCGERISVIDFKRFSLGDPAKDLGSFLLHMQTLACFSGRPLEEANHEKAFLDGYFSSTPLAKGAALVPRIAPFVAYSCLEALHRVGSAGFRDSIQVSSYLRCALESGILRRGPHEILHRPAPPVV